jgi:rare lipoprotein A
VLRRTYANLFRSLVRLSGALLLLLIPAASLASTGGATVSSSSPSGTSVQKANRTETASGDGITVHAVASGVLTWRTRFSGTAPARDAGRIVEVERTLKPGSRRWTVAAKATVAKGGTFLATWRADKAGKLAFRVLLMRSASSASAAAASPALQITVYRLSKATWYGPGFFGHKTACGITLRKTTLGVANRTLRCGTKVSILYHGHAIKVPVIDRGPYGNGAYWDLTQATAQALGMTETSRIGTLFPA